MTTTRDMLNDFAAEIEELLNRIDITPISYKDEREFLLDEYERKVKVVVEKERKRYGKQEKAN